MTRAATQARRRCVALAVVASGLVLAPSAARGDHTGEHARPATRDHLSLESSTFLCGSPPMSTHGGQMAFWKDMALIECGNDDSDLRNDGFVIADISEPKRPEPIGSFACVGTANDIGIWKDLVFVGVDTGNTTAMKPWEVTPGGGFAFRGPADESCDAEIVTRDENYPRRCEPEVPLLCESGPAKNWHGLRILSIANPAAPRLVKNIRLGKKGLHNLSLLPDLDHRSADGTPEPRLMVYVSSPGDPVHIVEVPLNAPENARSLFDSHPDTPTPDYPVELRPGCHDIAFFTPRQLGVCNNLEAGTRLWETSDPARPKAVGKVLHVPYRRDHSSAVSWDGNVLVVTDESHEMPVTQSCLPVDGEKANVLWYYDIRDLDHPKVLDTQAPIPLVGKGGCHPKQVNVVPLRSGEDVAVVSWLAGGTSVERFPDEDSPAERLGYYAASGVDDPQGTFVFASYWYGDRIYANNTYGCGGGGVPCVGARERGLDVLRIVGADGGPDPAFEDVAKLRRFNFGTQECLPAPYGDAHGSSLDCGDIE